MNILNKLTSILEPSQTGEAEIASHVLTALVGNSTLSAWNTAAQTALRAAVTEVDNGIDHLREAFVNFTTDNPVVARGITIAEELVQGQGLQLPTGDGLVTHLKAAVADLAGALGVTATASSATGASSIQVGAGGAGTGTVLGSPGIPDPALVATGGVAPTLAPASSAPSAPTA